MAASAPAADRLTGMAPSPSEEPNGNTPGEVTTQVVVPTSLRSPAFEIARRVLIVLAIAFGVWLVAIAAQRDDDSLSHGTGNPRVVSTFPLLDAQAPSQTQVGVQLMEGFDGVLAINGTPIPEAQLDGARDPAQMTPEEIDRLGIRPNNRNRVYFTPGPGKVFKSIPKGKVTVTVNFFRDRQPGVDAGTFTWTFTVQ